MKTFLSIAVTAFLAANLSAQVLESDNFEALKVGSLNAPVSGSGPGQGDWYVYGGAVDDYQIAELDTAHGKSLTIAGSSTASGTKYAFKSDLGDAWEARTAGNDALQVSFEIHTFKGPSGAGIARSYIFDDKGSAIVGLGYNFADGKLIGYILGSGSGGAGVYSLTLGSKVYPANTWIPVSYTFNSVTGKASFTTPDGVYSVPTTLTPTGAGKIIGEHDFISSVTTGNNVAHVNAFDNYKAEAIIPPATLATKEATINSFETVKIYPNPAVDVITIGTQGKIAQYKILDMSGKIVATGSKDKSINVSNLSKGNYIIVVETETGKFSEKFIKK